MLQLTKEEYYAQEGKDSFIDSENVADMKIQKRLNEETTLYAMSLDSSEVMVSNMESDLFFIETSIEEVEKYYAE